MHIGESNTPRLRACIEVMLYRGESFGITLLMRCVAICYAERDRLRLGVFSVLTGDAGGLRVAFWGCLTIGGGGFANGRFLWARGVA